MLTEAVIAFAASGAFRLARGNAAHCPTGGIAATVYDSACGWDLAAMGLGRCADSF